LSGKGEFVAAGDGLEDDVGAGNAGGGYGGDGAGEEGLHDGGVPAGVEDADAEGGCLFCCEGGKC